MSKPMKVTLDELDALIATEVMGWPEHPDLFSARHDETGFVISGLAYILRSERRHDYFTPSRSIADAWEVVEHVQQANPGWRFSLLGGDTTLPFNTLRGTRFGGPFGWRAEFFGHEDASKDYGQRRGEGHHASAPVAICLAALASQGIKVELVEAAP